MQIVASRELTHFPWNIGRLAEGEILLHAFTKESSYLECYDADLRPLWEICLDRRVLAMAVSRDGKPWVFDEGGVSVFDNRGQVLSRVDVQMSEGMQLSAFAVVDDGFVCACALDNERDLLAPTLQRINSDGTVRWSTTIPVGTIACEGCVQSSADEGWKVRPVDAWQPLTWVSASSRLTVSGDAVLAGFVEMPRSGIGRAYSLSLDDGSIRFTTKTGPLHNVGALGDGAFLVGYQGYGAFETLRYERNGFVQASWASQGHYVISGRDIRVIEVDNTIPSRSHIARLAKGGTVRKGAWLVDPQPSAPFLSEDGWLFFICNEELLAARNLSIHKRLVLWPPDISLFPTEIVGNATSIYLAFSQHSPNPFVARLVRVDFERRPTLWARIARFLAGRASV